MRWSLPTDNSSTPAKAVTRSSNRNLRARGSCTRIHTRSVRRRPQAANRHARAQFHGKWLAGALRPLDSQPSGAEDAPVRPYPMTRQARIFCILTTAVVIVTGLALQAQAPQRTGTAAAASH